MTTNQLLIMAVGEV